MNIKILAIKILLLGFFQLPQIVLSQDVKEVKKIIKEFVENYESAHAKVAPSKLDRINVNKENESITIYVSKGLQEQYYTDSIVKCVYDELRDTLPDTYKSYKLTIIADNHEISELVPNSIRDKANIDHLRLEKTITHKITPWIHPKSKPYKITNGLNGRHLAIWQSHGRYYTDKKERWEWQRPRLFCTSEDIFTQTFVIPYIIPMLENSGAIVYTPRERDWQKNEVIVDNDHSETNGSYIESSYSNLYKWCTLEGNGFAHNKKVYTRGENPFQEGTAKYTTTTPETNKKSSVFWIPQIPEDGKYAVYISYKTTPQSISNAHYRVFHKGGCSDFLINQKMGGGTWVYLGTFEFCEGVSEYGMVELNNCSNENGIVTADAVRFGGGMGNIARGNTPDKSTLSGFPRWAEGALYNLQWSGMPDSITYGRYDNNDYKNDINTRSWALNYLSGGSAYNPQSTGLGIPIEMSIGIHSDAGYKPDTELVGTLAIYNTKANGGKTPTGTDRYASRDLTSILLQNLATDLKKYNWRVRGLWNRDYSEAREPLGIAAILELLSHQNWADLRLGHNPNFKFDLSRSVYKTILKFLATQHSIDYTVHPLPINTFAADLDAEKGMVHLSWIPTEDHTEPTAQAKQYVLYTRKGNASFDNGRIIDKNLCKVKIQPGVIYSFRVTALNNGGESFPSEVLCAYISPQKAQKKILIVNAFNRLDGPAEIYNDTLQGFDLDIDPGVPYGSFAGYCGNQQCFDRATIGKVTPDGLGYSGNEFEGEIIMGNTFDYPYIHGLSIASTGNFSFTSISEKAFCNNAINHNVYDAIDVIFGVQKEFDKQTASILEKYFREGGNILVSGANLFDCENFNLQCLGVGKDYKINDKTITTIVAGDKLSAEFFRLPNPTSYCVPSPTVLRHNRPNTHAILNYKNAGIAASIHYNNSQKAITMGFPFESITTASDRNIIMKHLLEKITE